MRRSLSEIGRRGSGLGTAQRDSVPSSLPTRTARCTYLQRPTVWSCSNLTSPPSNIHVTICLSIDETRYLSLSLLLIPVRGRSVNHILCQLTVGSLLFVPRDAISYPVSWSSSSSRAYSAEDLFGDFLRYHPK